MVEETFEIEPGLAETGAENYIQPKRYLERIRENPVILAKDLRGFALKMGIYVIPFAILQPALTPYLGEDHAKFISFVGFVFTIVKGETNFINGFIVPNKFMVNLENSFPWLKHDNI